MALDITILTIKLAMILAAFESLTGQRPTITRSVKDNASLKVRSGMISGVKTTLRKIICSYF